MFSGLSNFNMFVNTLKVAQYLYVCEKRMSVYLVLCVNGLYL